MQADPLGLVDGASVYRYALQNPGRYSDPTGEFVPALLWGFAFGAGLDFLFQYLNAGGELECVDYAQVFASGLFGAGFSTFGTTGLLFGRGGAKGAQYGYGFQGLLNRGNSRFGWSFNGSRNVLSFRRGSRHFDLLPGYGGIAKPWLDGSFSGLLGAIVTGAGCGCSNEQ